MNSIISYLLIYNQYLLKIISKLLWFITKNIPLRQHAFDDSNSPKYQKFKVDKLPVILNSETVDAELLIAYYKHKYNYVLKPIKHQPGKKPPKGTICPRCGANHDYIYFNNGDKGQFVCKVCNKRFVVSKDYHQPLILKCPYCGSTLEAVKNRKHFKVHKCRSLKCSYYKRNLSKISPSISFAEKSKHKLHYLYREFTVDFFAMDLKSLPKAASSLNFTKFNPHIMGLCLTYRINLQLSTRKTAHAMREIHGINMSHTTVANYVRAASAVVKIFVDSYDYTPSNILSADETYVKVKGVHYYVWFIMDACKKSILGYQVSDNRGVGPCILTMRMAFDKFKNFPGSALRFVADGYSAYPLAKQEFEIKEGKKFNVTQVIGLTNDDPVSKEFRWIKQVVERLNRTFKASYRNTNGYGCTEGANSDVALWVAYYNFLRPHNYTYWKPLNTVKGLSKADNMPGKWQLLIRMSQELLLKKQLESSKIIP